jgi:hypothetical protein
MADRKLAKYMEKDGEVKLFGGEDVEGAQSDGWSEPKFKKSNGEDWNPSVRDDEVAASDAQAEVMKSNAARQEKIDAEQEKEDKKAEADKARKVDQKKQAE